MEVEAEEAQKQSPEGADGHRLAEPLKDDDVHSNDSEAETEILPGSQKPTPRKRNRVKEEVEDSRIDNRGQSPQKQQGLDVDPDGKERRSDASDRATASRKRKAEDEPDSSAEPESRRVKGHHRARSETGSKKARLSSPEDPAQESEEELASHESDSGEESGSGEEVIGAGRRRRTLRRSSPPPRLRKHASGGDAQHRAYNFKHPNDSSSLRISTSGHRTTSPSSPTLNHPASAALYPRSPYLRSNHRRSSSFHTTAINLVPEEMDLNHTTARRFGSSVSVGEGESSGRSASQPAPAARKLIDRVGRTPLARACAGGDLEKVKSLLESPPPGLDPNRPDHSGNTALQIAALAGFTEIVKMLLDHGCEVNTINGLGDTPLEDAMDNGHEDVVRLLTDAGAKEKQNIEKKPDVKTKHPNFSYLYMDLTTTNLVKSIKGGDTSLIAYLLQSVEPNNECLVAAIEGKVPELPGLLLAHKANPSPSSHPIPAGQKTPLVAAIDVGNNDAIKLLLQHEVDPRKHVPGKSLSHVKYCRERKAPGWKAAYNVLLKEKRRLANADSSYGAASSDASPSEDEPPRDARSLSPKLKSPKATETIASPTKVATPTRPKSVTPPPPPPPPTPKPTAAELAEIQAKEHAAYLQTLPARLSTILGAHPTFKYHDPTTAAALDHSLTDFIPMYGVPLSLLQPLNATAEHNLNENSNSQQSPHAAPTHAHAPKSETATNSNPTDIYIPSFYTAVILGTPTLDEAAKRISFPTIPLTKEQKATMWRARRLFHVIGTPKRWELDHTMDFARAKAAGIDVRLVSGASTTDDASSTHAAANGNAGTGKAVDQSSGQPVPATEQNGAETPVGQTPMTTPGPEIYMLDQRTDAKKQRAKFLALPLFWHPLHEVRKLAEEMGVRPGKLRVDVWEGGERLRTV